jgi:hypothetical protein
MVEDMVFKLDKRNAVRPKPNNGINIKPVVIFGYLQVYFTASKNVPLLSLRAVLFQNLAQLIDRDAG